MREIVLSVGVSCPSGTLRFINCVAHVDFCVASKSAMSTNDVAKLNIVWKPTRNWSSRFSVPPFLPRNVSEVTVFTASKRVR